MITTTTSTLTVPTTLPVCEAPGGIPCNDDDPCTDDVCTPGVGCEHAGKDGLAGLTCSCERSLPAACSTIEQLPRSVVRFTNRACRLFTAAVDAKPKKQARRIRQAAKALRRAESAVVRAQTRGLAPECAAALAEQYRGTADLAAVLLAQF